MLALVSGLDAKYDLIGPPPKQAAPQPTLKNLLRLHAPFLFFFFSLSHHTSSQAVVSGDLSFLKPHKSIRSYTVHKLQ